MLIIAFFVPISIISIKRFFSDTINTKSDIKNNSSVPIIGLIGHSDKSTSLVVPNSTKSIITESFRSLRTNIQYIAADKTKNYIRYIFNWRRRQDICYHELSIDFCSI